MFWLEYIENVRKKKKSPSLQVAGLELMSCRNATSINGNDCFWSSWVATATLFHMEMETQPVSETVRSFFLNRRWWAMSNIQVILRITRISVEWGRIFFSHLFSLCCLPHITFHTLLAMGGNIKDNVKYFLDNVNFYVVSYLCITLGFSAALCMTKY
jgi:hypothetical protein